MDNFKQYFIIFNIFFNKICFGENLEELVAALSLAAGGGAADCYQESILFHSEKMNFLKEKMNSSFNLSHSEKINSSRSEVIIVKKNQERKWFTEPLVSEEVFLPICFDSCCIFCEIS